MAESATPVQESAADALVCEMVTLLATDQVMGVKLMPSDVAWLEKAYAYLESRRPAEPPKVSREGAHTPTPYHIEEGEGVFYIVRRWEDGKVYPGSEPTFGSGFGAHIADISFHSGSGVATKARALGNARFIVQAVNSFGPLVKALERICHTVRGRNESDLPIEHRECLEIARSALSAAGGAQ